MTETLVANSCRDPRLEDRCVICGDTGEILLEFRNLSKALKSCLELISDSYLTEECYGKFLCSTCNIDLEAVQTFRVKCLQSSYVLEKQRQRKQQKEQEERIDLEEPEYDSNALIKEEVTQSDKELGSDEDPEEDYVVVVTEDCETLSNELQVDDTTPQEKSEKCPDCGKEFKSITSFKRHHYRIHRMTRKTYSCTYKSCYETFTNGYRLNVHLRRHQNTPFICHFCQKPFYDKAYLIEHLKMVHLKSAPPIFTCTTCDKSFNRKSKWKIHSRIHSETAKKHVCEVCDKKFITKEKLSRHLLVHTGDRPYVCRVCRIAYKSSYALKKHTIKCG